MAIDASAPVREPVHEFDYVREPALARDLHGTYWKLKEEAPAVFWTHANGGHWVVNCADAAIEVLRHPDRFSSKFLSIPPNPAQPKMIPESLDPPEHRPYRQLLRPFFESKAIEPLEPRIRDWAERLVDAVIDKGECEFVDALGSRFPVSVFMEMFGFPLDQFDFFRATVVEYFDAQVDEQRRLELTMQILGTLTQLIEARRAEPRDDLVSTLVHIDFEGRKLQQDELISIGFLMFLAGLDTVVNALTFGMRHLAGDEALRTRMIEDRSAIPAIVEELMRRYTFVSTPRYITQDTEIAGTKVYAGDSVLVPLHVVGWDEKLTSCPAEVRLDRPHCRHAGFGSGIHTCLGIHLARLEMTVFYETWARKIGHFRMTDGQDLRFRGGSVQALEALHLEWDPSR
ncbi:cytochrome P450 [Novosphingobium kunmingense]|uniref:Cytochrome P450 n=1 Tax=Novosphingobium kunmingense TaxID=1211806 RepID=A0A2N0H5Y9_9SPHN|nr:cytochrome P450 [Novosphingobium kunmingense]PKB14355.1 cytochrome P450 [Novosphingobium kunmingense]